MTDKGKEPASEKGRSVETLWATRLALCGNWRHCPPMYNDFRSRCAASLISVERGIHPINLANIRHRRWLLLSGREWALIDKGVDSSNNHWKLPIRKMTFEDILKRT
ncbi:hypothetical protein MA16_Dca022605 [Dendrobium catenatum]|uniref:Uncharacterized protein n=1 Tax=Dendrobium catenatum TaxID=906689 RepID=A0A2I0VBA2_9ASPA|nr:hypothetical protein MA16_Dca022605 [Dendrobium catenatum]